MMILRPLLGFILVAGNPLLALAQVSAGGTFKCVDEAGRSTYTNVKEEMGGKKCTVVSREVSVVPAPNVPATPGKPASAAARPASTAPAGGSGPQRVEASTQRSRDNDRRRILDQELQSAEQQLSTAKQALIQQEAIRTGDERNYQRVLDRLKPFQEDVRRAEENVASLKREISNLR
jgi:hypothetical protein